MSQKIKKNRFFGIKEKFNRILSFGIVFASININTSCLVTEEGSIDVIANYPPTIAASENLDECDHPIGSIIDLTENDATSLCMRVNVEDPNITQDLEYAVYIDFPEKGTALERQPLLSQGGFRREHKFYVPINLLSPNTCHKIEFLVSGELSRNTLGGVDVREPIISGDMAKAVWWVRYIDESSEGIRLQSCLRFK